MYIPVHVVMQTDVAKLNSNMCNTVPRPRGAHHISPPYLSASCDIISGMIVQKDWIGALLLLLLSNR